MSVIRVGRTSNSGADTGTGAVQTIAHGIGAIPIAVYIFVPTTGELLGASCDSTNIYPSVTLNAAYNWLAIL